MRARRSLGRSGARPRPASKRKTTPWLGEALLGAAASHDLVVVAAHAHARATGIVLGETATLLVHRSEIPVLIARERPLECVARRRARRGPAPQRARGGASRAIVAVAEGDDAGRSLVGSTGRRGPSAVAGVSERVAHLAPCSVLVMRGL